MMMMMMMHMVADGCRWLQMVADGCRWLQQMAFKIDDDDFTTHLHSRDADSRDADAFTGEFSRKRTEQMCLFPRTRKTREALNILIL